MNPKAIILDLDGTILDSMPMWHKIDADFLAENGKSVPHGLSEIIKPMSFSEAADYFIEQFGLRYTRDQVMRRIREMAEEQYRRVIPLKPYALEFIKEQHEKGRKLCIATATHIELAEAALRRLGLSEYFEFILTCKDIGAEKDKPDIYLKSAELLGLPIKDTIVVEDALHCVITAKGAGFYTVGVYDSTAENEAEKIKKGM